MTLLKLKAAPFILIEDDYFKNTLPLLNELSQPERCNVNLFSYEQPLKLWKSFFKNKPGITIHNEFKPADYENYTSSKGSVIIDSIYQMVLCLGWRESLKYLQKLQMNANVVQLIVILHKDCLTQASKLQIHLNHIVNAIISYNTKHCNQITVTLKKAGKVSRSEELLYYDDTIKTLRCTPVINEAKTIEKELTPPLPANLTTFKIEMEQSEKLEKYKLKLPYMSKINEGESKVFYEPDAVDDWDEEDPDEDLDI